MNAILYNGSLWVAGGTNIKYSIDGISWTTVASSPTQINSLAWTGSEWLACCDGSNNLYYSNNAIQWYPIQVLSAYNLYKIAYHQNTIFALSDSTIYYSKYANTYSWNVYSDPSLGAITDYAYTGSHHTFVSGSYILVSQDLVSWTKVAKPSSGSFVVANVCNQGTATIKPITVACADSSYNTLLYSVDGIMWYGSGTSGLTNANAIEWNGTYWLAVGSSSNSWYAMSRTGDNWMRQYDSTLDIGTSVAWNGSVWLVGGTKTGVSRLATSIDGVTWSLINLSVSGNPYVCWNGYKWLVSSGSHVYSSVDLLTWTPETIASGSIQVATVQNYTKGSNLYDASVGWVSSIGTYDASGNGSIELQADMGSPIQLNHYSLNTNASNYTLYGSPDTIAWYAINTQSMNVSANNILLTFINNTAYRYYKIIFTKIADQTTALYLSQLAFYTSSGVSKPLILHKSWTASFVSNYIQYLGIPSAYLNGRALQSTGPIATSYSYNGQYSVLTDSSSIYYSATDFSFNPVSTSISNLNASAYNGTYFFVGGTSIQYAHPSNMTTWHNTINVDTLLGGGTVKMLKSNTGLGFNASPNALYVTPGEKLSIVAPKFYDQSIEKRGTTIMFSLT